ncbi:MAG: hypothetical protein U1F46_11260 [Marinagarivorans sp.]
MSANPHRSLFLTISSLLTGFSEVELLGTGMCDTYLKTLQEENNPATLEYFFVACAEVLRLGEGDKEKINNLIALRLMPDSCYDSLAKNIIFMWYMGQWAPSVNQATNLAQARNISPNAYVQGLVWNLADTHPPGAKQPGFGSWAKPPVNNSI